MLSALRAVPTHGWMDRFLSKVGEQIRAQGTGGANVCIACFDNWDKYIKQRDRNLPRSITPVNISALRNKSLPYFTKIHNGPKLFL